MARGVPSWLHVRQERSHREGLTHFAKVTQRLEVSTLRRWTMHRFEGSQSPLPRGTPSG